MIQLKLFQKDSGNAWIVCLSAGLFFFYVFFQMNIFDVINQPLRHSFQINAEQLSWMSSWFTWGSILFFLPAGLIVDRYSIRKIILVNMLLCTISTLGFSFTHSYLLACLLRSFIGIANAFCFTSCIVLAYRYFPADKQALVTGSIITMAFFGGMMAHTPFAHLSIIYGWRKAVYVDAIVGGVILAWLFIAIKDKPRSLKLDTNIQAWLKDLPQVLLNKQNWFASIYTACLNLLIMVLCALWGTDYLKKVHYLTEFQASSIISMILMGSMCGGPLFGLISDKIGRRRPVMLLGALTTLMLLVPLLLNIHLSFKFLIILFFLLGLFSSTQILSYPLIAESNKTNTTGLATAVASIIVTGSGGLGQIVFGKLLQFHAQTTSFLSSDFQYAFILLPFGLTISCIMIVGIKETYCARLNDSMNEDQTISIATSC